MSYLRLNPATGLFPVSLPLKILKVPPYFPILVNDLPILIF